MSDNDEKELTAAEETAEEAGETVEEEIEAVAEEAKAAAEDATEAADAAPAKKKGFNPHKRTSPAYAPGKYAVIETGGKQYRVAVGDKLTVEKLDVEAGSDVTFDRVLLVSGDGSTKIGTPVVAGATVSATIDDHGRGDKIIVFKYKAKKRYRRRTGHRQSQTYVTITGITG